MLNQDEEPFEKELPPGVEALLEMDKAPLSDLRYKGGAGETSGRRNKTKVRRR